MATSGVEGPDWSDVSMEAVVKEVRDPTTHALLRLVVETPVQVEEPVKVVES